MKKVLKSPLFFSGLIFVILVGSFIYYFDQQKATTSSVAGAKNSGTQSISFASATVTFVASTTPQKTDSLWGAEEKYTFFPTEGTPDPGKVGLVAIGEYSTTSVASSDKFRDENEGYVFGYSFRMVDYSAIERQVATQVLEPTYDFVKTPARTWVAFDVRCVGESCRERYYATPINSKIILVQIDYWFPEQKAEADALFRNSRFELK